MAKTTTTTKKTKKSSIQVATNGKHTANGALKEITRKMENAGPDLTRRFEKIPTEIYSSSAVASKAVANEIAQFIRSKQILNKPCVLGLATGSTPKAVYKELVRMHKQEGLSFKNVITFNLDEYYPMDPESLHSYVRFMKVHLFNHIDIPKGNWHIPDGTIATDKIAEFCQEYERKIEAAGGIDLQLLGIGHTGHVGFNEPGSRIDSKTRLIALDHSTRAAASGEFNGLQNTPRKAITLGVSAIMNAKRVILMAWGEGKAPVIKLAVEGSITERVPASYLQNHSNCTYVLDEPAASLLTRVKTPWLVENCVWDKQTIRKAVTHLALTLNKPILKLTDKDYNDNGMSDLLAAHAKGHAYDINIDV
ncbi:MAG: glucosamine-6-phosphate deaminase, partial [Cytophagaceae bacterium]|nr:glucosamine-6-phosphate deaminase [Cytophagaceae bacterium]